jgi:hypothetical protein
MMKRIPVLSAKTLGAAAFVAQVFLFQACGSNSPSNTTGSAGATGSAGSGNGTGTAGTTGTGGSSAAGTTGTGGSIGGTTGGAGTTGAGGSTSALGNACGMGFGLPTCASTVSKGGVCAATDVQCCYKTCGPETKGVKSELCQTSGTYSEMSGCAFDATKDYSCYKIPAAADPECPAGMTPQATKDCGTVAMCHACNSTQGMPGGGYLDSGGSAKTGFCVCQAPNAQGARVWSCATDNGSWPCPGNSGC